MAAANPIRGTSNSSSIPVQRSAAARDRASGWKAADALAWRAQRMKARVGAIEARPIRAKVATLAQKKGLAW